MTTSHTATITIEQTDRALVQRMVFAAVRAVGDHYGEAFVAHSMTIYHDRDQPYTARLTWQTDPDLVKATE